MLTYVPWEVHVLHCPGTREELNNVPGSWLEVPHPHTSILWPWPYHIIGHPWLIPTEVDLPLLAFGALYQHPSQKAMNLFLALTCTMGG